MAEKKLYTRAEFETFRRQSAKDMAADETLRNKAVEVLAEADRYHWIHQTNWFGEPILNLPQDMFALQEAIYSSRPKYIVEVGVAWGGSLLFNAGLLELLDGEKVIGIDIYIPDDLKERIGSHKKLARRIEWINGSSIEPKTIGRVKGIIGDCSDVLVLLDSHHTHDHVLQELRMYSPLVGEGQYLICGDTIVESLPEQKHRPREWGPGNNPMTALIQFQNESDCFALDETIDNKLLFSCNPRGYLKRVKKEPLALAG